MDKKLINCLSNDKVFVKYIRKSNPLYDQTNHVSVTGGLHEKARKMYSCPVSYTDNSYLKILTEDEFDYLQSVINSDISYTNEEFWRNITFVLKKTGQILDKSNPMQYIQWRMLLAWTDPEIVGYDRIIGTTNLDRENENPAFQFVLVDPGKVKSTKKEAILKRNKALMKLGKYEENREVLTYLLYVSTKDHRIPADTEDNSDLVIYFDEMISNNPALFIRHIEDKLLEAKASVFSAFLKGIVKKEGESYFFNIKGNLKKLGSDRSTADLETAANFILDPVNQEIKLAIEASLSAEKNK